MFKWSEAKNDFCFTAAVLIALASGTTVNEETERERRPSLIKVD